MRGTVSSERPRLSPLEEPLSQRRTRDGVEHGGKVAREMKRFGGSDASQRMSWAAGPGGTWAKSRVPLTKRPAGTEARRTPGRAKKPEGKPAVAQSAAPMWRRSRGAS